MLSHDFGLRQRDGRIQVIWHSTSGHLNTFGASSNFPECMMTQNRWLRLRILAVAKLHLTIWLLSGAMLCALWTRISF